MSSYDVFQIRDEVLRLRYLIEPRLLPERFLFLFSLFPQTSAVYSRMEGGD